MNKVIGITFAFRTAIHVPYFFSALCLSDVIYHAAVGTLDSYFLHYLTLIINRQEGAESAEEVDIRPLTVMCR